MKITISLPRSIPSVDDTQVLVKFAIKKVEEVKNQEHREPPAIWIALILAAVAEEDHEFYDRLKELVSSTANNAETIFKMKDLFRSALGLSQDESLCSDEREAYPFPDERICRQILGVCRT